MSTVSADKSRVIVLHGIWNARAWVGPLAWRGSVLSWVAGPVWLPWAVGWPGGVCAVPPPAPEPVEANAGRLARRSMDCRRASSSSVLKGLVR